MAKAKDFYECGEVRYWVRVRGRTYLDFASREEA